MWGLTDPHLGEEYTLLQLKHYAEYDYKQLKPFLIQTIYPLEKAYKIVEERKVLCSVCVCVSCGASHQLVYVQLYPEMVYILGRMGNTKDALDLIIQKIGDVKQAIEFVQEQRDEELWGDLITQSMRNPKVRLLILYDFLFLFTFVYLLYFLIIEMICCVSVRVGASGAHRSVRGGEPARPHP